MPTTCRAPNDMGCFPECMRRMSALLGDFFLVGLWALSYRTAHWIVTPIVETQHSKPERVVVVVMHKKLAS